jgi:zeta-carotene desaturase
MDKKLSHPSVTIIGGGAAGLSAAVFLARKNFKVILIEASGKLGGRAYSYFDDILEDTVDNGQHILAGWYKNTFEFLEIIGSSNKLYFQKQLSVRFIKQDSSCAYFKCTALFPLLNLFFGILRYNALSFNDKLSIFRLITAIGLNKFNESLVNLTAEEYLKLSGQTTGIIHFFWNPLIIAVFNAKSHETSAKLFVNLLKTGLLKRGNSRLVLPLSTLGRLYIEPATEYLNLKGTEIKLNTRVKKLHIKNDKVESAELQDSSFINTDYFISAVPFWEFKSLIGENIYDSSFKFVDELKNSEIVNIYFKFESEIDNIIKNNFTGVLDSTIQWIFRIKNDHLCLVISRAGEVAKFNKEDIIQFTKRELFHCYPALMNVKIKSARVLKEKRATFIPDNDSLNSRPGQITKLSNFYIAGDWTDTGLPATIESAVKSSKICVNEILKKIVK